MAQTGYTPISIYYSATASNTPTAGNLVAGELALNTADGKLFYKDSSNVVQVIGTKGGVGTSSTTQVLYNSSGLVVGSANMTFSGTALTLANDASISGLTVGKGGGAVATNTALGYQAGYSNTTGTFNSFFGYQAGYTNTTSSQNTGVGHSAMNLTTGANNTAYGYGAMTNATTTSGSVALGRLALSGVCTGADNTSVGNSSMQSNTSGASNTAVGSQALLSNTTASNNTAVGYQAGYSNTTGTRQAFFGYGAGYSTTTGSSNSAFGIGSLYNNSTGQFNTAIGDAALINNTTASQNTAVGYQAGYTNQTGTFNTFIGQAAGYFSNGSGNSANTCIGSYAGYNLSTGTGNTFIGSGTTYQSGTAITTGSKNTIIGAYNGNLGGLDIRTASNYIVLSDGDGNPRLSIPTGTATATIPNATGTVMVSGNMPAFSAYLNTTQATSSGTVTKVTCNTKEFDTASAYDNATNYRFTPLVAGYYQVTGEIQYAATVSTAVCTAILYKNGSQFKTGAQVHASTTKAIGSIVSALVYFNGTTDYVELYAYQDTGFSQNLNGSAANVYFQACMLRSA